VRGGLGASGRQEVNRERCESQEDNGADQWNGRFWSKHANSLAWGVAGAAGQRISGILANNVLARSVNKEQIAGMAPRGAMPISSYLDGEQFDPETRRIMGLAFDLTRAALRISNQDDIAPEIIAKKVIELAKGGERDPERLCDYALANLRLGMPQTLLK
jgi:hypothetical protein